MSAPYGGADTLRHTAILSWPAVVAVTTLVDRAEHVPVKALLGRTRHDPRTAAEYARALAEETERSLAKDPTRWPWRTLGDMRWQRAGWRET